MAKYILKRLVISLVTIWAIATLCFFLLRLLPGNPFILQNPLDMKNAERMMSYYGLDRPILEQYGSYMWNLLHLDFGTYRSRTAPKSACPDHSSSSCAQRSSYPADSAG